MEIQERESHQKNNDWTVSILSSNTVTEDNPYTLYEIQVTSPSSPSKRIKRRFRQFWALHVALSNMDKTLPPFPISRVLNKMNPEVIQEREYQLQAYLRLLLTRPQLFHSFRMKLFLGLVNMEGRTCIITGSNSGIGLETARALAWMGMHVVMACRSEEKTLPVVESLKEETRNANIEFMYLDLSSLVSVKNFVENFRSKGRPLHLLVNNAGCLAEQGVTTDGFEITFGVNYLGHFLLTILFLDLLCKSVTSRIVFVCDEFVKVRPITSGKVKSQVPITGVFEAYELSKQACLYFANELTRRLDRRAGVAVFCAFPGGSATNLFRRLPVFMDWIVKKFVRGPEEGALPVIFCAISEELEGRSGVCIDSTCQEKAHDPPLLNLEDSTALWRLSQFWISEIFRVNTLESDSLFKIEKQEPVIMKIDSKEDLNPFKKLSQPLKIGMLGHRNVPNGESDSDGYGEYGAYETTNNI